MAEPHASADCPACGTELSIEHDSEGLCPSCLVELALEQEAFPSAAPTFSSGQVLGKRYRIRSLLGRGGMGAVWRAFDLKLQVDVALKALKADLLTDKRALDSLRHEVRMAREVVSPNVCRVFDLVELEGQELISMEYIDGTTLLDILRNRAPLELAEAREIASQFLAGLEAIHDAELVHRDVKPENLMITRSGRVVLMDFGLAKGLAEAKAGRVSGTPAYMSPEQSRGEALDARADVFSAGVVLAEMMAPKGLKTLEARQEIWQGIRSEPPVLPESPWAHALQTAVDASKQQRHASAAVLSRALEEVTLRVAGAEGFKPYPGLAPFTVDEAGYFFGRELEVEAMWKRLPRSHLLGLIGPSGAGKSSFVRAGLLPVVPGGWRVVVLMPGRQPFSSLARAFVPELEGDPEALQRLTNADDADSVVEAVTRWRQKHDETLLIVDQFEELFTQNTAEVQDGFARLLGRLAVDADVRVLLSMRDDFLFFCSQQEALAPLFSQLTPLKPLSDAGIRRALVQPALKCGYRFEDDSLVDEMVGEVSDERGALPLLAFAASRLWDHRDRKRGVLTREAYEHIDGVGGALAQHAERTLETIGQDNVPIVRELFRNLVTAEGTRSARTRDELLSVFERGHDPAPGHDPNSSGIRDRVPDLADHVPTANNVLDTLIDARLLTSYEVPGEDDESSQQRVEIIHESLLSNWPRLVRWQIQDADSAQLRDQVRQVAQLWEERGRPEDLLWTGTSFGEYRIWRERYSGGLTATEEEFAEAMTARAERHRSRRRLSITTAFALLLGVLAVVGFYWRESAAQALRAEANQLLALGRLEMENNPTGALAYALASLERADDPIARLFALEALWRGPAALVLEGTSTDSTMVSSVDFSPDGRWLAGGFDDGSLKLWSSDGGAPRLLDQQEGLIPWVRFGPESDFLVSRGYPSHEIEIRAVPDGDLIRTLPTTGPADFRLSGDRRRLFTFTQQESGTRVETWPLVEGGPELVGDLDTDLFKWSRWQFSWNLDIDLTGQRLAYIPFIHSEEKRDSSPEVYLASLDRVTAAVPELVERQTQLIARLAFQPGREALASADEAGEVRIWNLDGGFESPERVLRHPAGWVRNLHFDLAGSRLAAASWSGHATIWNLQGAPDAEPMLLRRGETYRTIDVAFHPKDSWLATASHLGVAIFPIGRAYPVDLRGHEKEVQDLAFHPEGRWLASVGTDCTLRLWPLSAAAAGTHRVLFDNGNDWLTHVAVDPLGRQALVGSRAGSVWLVPVDGTSPRQLGGFNSPVQTLALGQKLAAAVGGSDSQNQSIRVWNLETDEVRDIQAGTRIHELRITPDGRLVSGGRHGVRIWNANDGSSETVSDEEGPVDLSRDGRLLLVGNQGQKGEPFVYDLEVGTSIQLDSHGPSFGGVLDPSGSIAITVPFEGPPHVGPATGGPAHLLVGQEKVMVPALAVSPDGMWVATISAGGSTTIRLWPIPDLSKPPLHTLPRDELLAKLRTLTNLRIIEDPESPTGWSWDLDPFPGWDSVPTW